MDGDGDDDHDDGTGAGNGDDNYDDGDDDDDTRPIFLPIDNMKVRINTSPCCLPLLSELARLYSPTWLCLWLCKKDTTA